jgi:ABC-type transport system involved in multi-copper enzyme maturation permease subunit/pimeloyl-ACP methyl ester carboxylesterase
MKYVVSLFVVAAIWATIALAQVDERTSEEPFRLSGAERGIAIRGFKASSDAAVRPLLVYLPEDYEPGQSLPLLVALNPTASANEELNTYFQYGLEQYANAEGFAVMCLNGRRGTGWDELAIHDALDALEIVQSRFPIDIDRIHLFGAGTGGAGAYSLGLRHPDLFAAMAVAEGVGPTDLAKNSLNLPQYMVNGVWRGTGYSELRNFRKMAELFSSYGVTVKHKEYPDDIRWPEFLAGEWEPIFHWFRQHRRIAYPRKVSYTTGGLSGQLRDRFYGAYWVRMNPGKTAYSIPQINVAITDNSVNVVVVNIRKYTLLLSDKLLDLNVPITVRTNGRISFSGKIEEKSISDNTATLTINLESRAMTWLFAAIVGVVVLVGLGLVCLRLIRIKARARKAVTTDVPKVTAGLRGIWLIAMKEFRVHLLTERFLWTMVLCLGMVLMSFWLMTQDYQTRLTEHSFSLRKPENLFSGSMLFWYDIQPNHRTGRGVYVRPTPVVKEPNVMSIFVQGLERRMARPAYFSIHQEVEFEDTPHTNFLMDMHARPDLMYVVQIAMSLLALLFVFRSICGEREMGTLKLMMANAVPRDTILLGKWIGGYMGLAIPFLLAMGVGMLTLNLMPSVSLNAEHWIRLTWLTLTSLLYISVFFTLGILISTLTRRTITSFLVALFAWVILVLVLPNIGTLLARELEPVESAQQLQVRKYSMKREMEDEHHKVKPSAYFVPHYGNTHFDIWSDVRDATWNLDSDYRRRTQHLADYTRILTRISPAAAYAYAMMDIAGTNISNELAYHDRLHRFIRNQPEKEYPFIYRMHRTHQKWNFHHTPVSWQEEVSRAFVDLLLLALLNVVLFLFAYLAFIRYQVT